MSHDPYDRATASLVDRPTESSPRRWRLGNLWPRRAWQRWLLGFGLVLLVLVGGGLGLRLWWGYVTELQLARAIAELQARGERVTLADFRPRPLPVPENAATLLTEAAELLSAAPVATAATRLADDYFFHPQLVRRDRARIVPLLNQLAPVFERVAEARGRPQAQWSVPVMDPAINTALPPAIWTTRTLGRLMAIRAVTLADAGDYDKAIRAIGDGLNLANWVQGEPSSLTTHLVGLAISTSNLIALEAILPELAVAPPQSARPELRPVGRERLRALIERLLDEDGPLEAWRRAIWLERLCFLDVTATIRQGTSAWALRMIGIPMRSRLVGWLLVPMFRQDALFVLHHMTAWAEAARHPTWPQAVVGLEYPNWDDPVQRFIHSLSRKLFPAFERTLETHYRNMAMRRMAAVAIAVRLYALDHDRRPETLEALVPDYLPAIPIDPFSDPPAPLRYAPDKDPPVLYSVNSDGQDDGGRFAQRHDGSIQLDRLDLVWFLDGNRPWPSTQPPPAEPNTPTATQSSNGSQGRSSERGEGQFRQQEQPG